MASRTYRTKAIVLQKTKLGEQDLILTMLAADGCQVRAVAKGARKPGGRLAARCELFSETDFLIARGRNLDVVSEASLLEPHANLRGDYLRFTAGECVLELARTTCFQDAPDPFLYPLLSRALRALEEAPDQAHLDLACAAYAFKVCAHGGWRPVLDSCVACGDPHPTWFSVQAGGALCESCAREVEGAEPVSEEWLAWVAALIGLTFDQLQEAAVTSETALSLLSTAHVWCATHLDARLRAFEFLLSV
ncbi:MAG: DNA repair protein RecO [Tractidigestivibacter sp.]|uniref:DNA repair protein RecO n=1 Tax=Tractidigestivibacter sp. TaxID=2847320 RepID=UPI003D8E4129